MARLCRRKRAGRVAIMMETGMQNGVLGIFIAAGLPGLPALSLVWLERRRDA